MNDSFQYIQDPSSNHTLQPQISSVTLMSLLKITCFIEIPVFNANSVVPDQTPHDAASDLGLHYLPMSLLWDAKHK